jgi:hypothetical protein
LDESEKKAPDNPMDHPEEQPAGTDAPFKFGKLLLLLAGSIVLIAIITMLSEAYYAS